MAWFTTYAAIDLVFWAVEIRQVDVESALKLKESSRSLSKGIPLSIKEELTLTGVDFHAETPTSIKTIVLLGLVAGLGYLVFWIVKSCN